MGGDKSLINRKPSGTSSNSLKALHHNANAIHSFEESGYLFESSTKNLWN
jgi:hypothetical protein